MTFTLLALYLDGTPGSDRSHRLPLSVGWSSVSHKISHNIAAWGVHTSGVPHLLTDHGILSSLVSFWWQSKICQRCSKNTILQ